eukprot:5037095-Pyramimonas_sp.AAC.1
MGFLQTENAGPTRAFRGRLAPPQRKQRRGDGSQNATSAFQARTDSGKSRKGEINRHFQWRAPAAASGAAGLDRPRGRAQIELLTEVNPSASTACSGPRKG